MESMKDGAPQIHEEYPNNILKHTTIQKGNYEEAQKRDVLADPIYNNKVVTKLVNNIMH